MGEIVFESSDMSYDEATVQCAAPTLMSSTMLPNNVRSDDSEEDIIRLFNNIQKACDENKLNKLPVFDFIKLYEDRIVSLNQRVAMLNSKMQEMSKEITVERHTALRFETTMLKCTAMAKSLQRSNELYVFERSTHEYFKF